MARVTLPADARDALERACEEIVLDPDRFERGGNAYMAGQLLEAVEGLIAHTLGDGAIPDALRAPPSNKLRSKLIHALDNLDNTSPEAAADVVSEIAGVRFEPHTEIAMPITAKVDAKRATAYAPLRRYALAESLVHPTYGVGVVREVTPTKVSVQFASGIKVLVHGRG